MKPTAYKVRASGRIEPFQSEKDAMEFAIFAHRAMKTSVTVMGILPNGVQQIIWRSVNEFTTNSMTKQLTASEMGKIGGSRKSEAKTKAARENAKKPRKKNAQAMASADEKTQPKETTL